MRQGIHLIAPAGSLQSFYKNLGVENGAQMMVLFQDYVGSEFQLTADLRILEGHEDELHGGRFDDDVRAEDITQALADDSVAAILAVRGGAWFTRILPHIDFSVLDRRTSPVTVFGFSELTSFINIVARHPHCRGYHDMGPAFLVYGLKRHAEQVLKLSDTTDPTPQQWMQHNLRHQIAVYLKEMLGLLRGRPAPPISATLIRGQLKTNTPATFVGGNLTVLSTMIGSRYADSIAPDSRWLMLEDFNDKPERFDRFLSHFTLADYWSRCSGLLLGDFHRDDTDLLPAILSMLDYHLLPDGFPVLATRQIGHVWPMVALPLNRAGRWRLQTDGRFQWHCDN
jgi:muramoyltetrapeptide carboxypeptidase